MRLTNTCRPLRDLSMLLGLILPVTPALPFRRQLYVNVLRKPLHYPYQACQLVSFRALNLGKIAQHSSVINYYAYNSKNNPPNYACQYCQEQIMMKHNVY
jgi:hypothetical protein